MIKQRQQYTWRTRLVRVVSYPRDRTHHLGATTNSRCIWAASSFIKSMIIGGGGFTKPTLIRAFARVSPSAVLFWPLVIESPCGSGAELKIKPGLTSTVKPHSLRATASDSPNA